MTGHIYGGHDCQCERCTADRAVAQAAGYGWILAAISALEHCQKRYLPSTRHWRACSKALQPLHQFMAQQQRKGGAT